MIKLAICIPTHHGRAVYLRELIKSILHEVRHLECASMEICISDNASQDSTGRTVAEFQGICPIPIKYFRFPENYEGTRNFINVIEMADAEYCWLMGSDDIIIEGALARVLKVIDENPSIGGITVNKINFDKSLETFLGPDHQIVLPADATHTHPINGAEVILKNLGVLFTYMSAHIFRRADWIAVVNATGFQQLRSFRHFPHTFIYSEIAKRYGTWLWLADYCVIQRLDNFCVLEERGNRRRIYATEVTQDAAKVWSTALEGDRGVYNSLMKRQLITYWNPLFLIKYKCEQDLSFEEERAMTRNCTTWFCRSALFWLLCFPLLITPVAILRGRDRSKGASFKAASEPTRLQPLVRKVMKIFSLDNAFTRRFDAAWAAGERFKKRRDRGGLARFSRQ